MYVNIYCKGAIEILDSRRLREGYPEEFVCEAGGDARVGALVERDGGQAAGCGDRGRQGGVTRAERAENRPGVHCAARRGNSTPSR